MVTSRIKKLAAYLRPHWRIVLFGVFALLVVNAVGVYIPSLIKDSIDELGDNFSLRDLSGYAVLLLVLASLMWVIRMVSRVLIFGIGRQVEFEIKQRIFRHLLSLEPGYFATNTSGDLMNRSTSDVDNIRRLLGFAVLSLANIVFAYGLTFPAMLAISGRLTLIAIAVYPVMIITVQLFSGKLQQFQRNVQEKLSTLSQLIQEDMSGISLIKIYAQEGQERDAFKQRNQQLLSANLSLARTRNLLFPLVEGISYVSLLLLLWFGTRAIASGEITVGDFVALLLYLERLVFPTALLGFTITTYQRGEVSIDRVDAILYAEAQVSDSPEAISLPLEQVRGKISFHNLTYIYPDATTPALSHIDLTIYPGETVAIVGSIGAGKSTLANLIPRLLAVKPGQLFLDGYDVTQLRLQDLRRAIAYVPQDSFLFSTTIKDNIRYGEPLSETQK